MGYEVTSEARNFTRRGVQLAMEICEVVGSNNIHILGITCIHFLHNIWLMYTDGDSSYSWDCFVSSCDIPHATRSNFHTS